VDRSGDTAALLRVAAQTRNQLLEIGGALGAVLRASQEHFAQLGRFHCPPPPCKAPVRRLSSLHEIIRDRGNVVGHGRAALLKLGWYD
jgi:hypothetical protein